MDKAWTEVIKVTGAVGVLAFLAYIVVNHLYSDKVIELFGSEKMFQLSVALVSFVFIILLVAVLKQKNGTVGANEQSELGEESRIKETKNPKVSYQDQAKHNGDNNF